MDAKSKVKWAALLMSVTMLPASANFHLMSVVEVFPGTAAAPNAQYIVLQMYAPGENFVNGRKLTVFDSAGAVIASFTFSQDVGNGADQAKILIATPEAEIFFGLTADLLMSPTLIATGGKACFAGTIDCIAWGNYTGSADGVGTPFNAASGLTSGRAAIRRLDIAGSATVLDFEDDTNNCANDFASGLPAPRNNRNVLGRIPGATCGNVALEGLEQCDDGNLVNGDGCSSTCTLEQVSPPPPPPPRLLTDDYDGDGKSDVLWRNSSTGANVIWKSGNAGTTQATTAVTSQSWQIVGKGDFNDDGKSDILWRNILTGANVIWKSANKATPQSVSAVSNLSWQVVGVGDFNDDGKSDILWRNTSTGANVIWKSGNKATSQAVAGVTNLAWSVVGIGDFNGDGKSDVLWRNTSTGANVIWSSANASTRQAMTGVTNQSWKVVGIGDFNDDGKSDALWRNTSTGANVIWKSANNATPQSVASVANQSWQVVQTGDFNDDGKTDILWRNISTGANVIWKSANAATKQAVGAVTNLAWHVVPYEGQALD